MPDYVEEKERSGYDRNVKGIMSLEKRRMGDGMFSLQTLN